MMGWMRRLTALLCTCAAVGGAGAASYPAGPITMVVPFAAGSGTDGVARVVAHRLGEELGQQVLVDNRAGASAQIGAQLVSRAKPDGYTLLMTTNTSHSANPSLLKSLPYDPIKGFTPIARIGELPFVLLVRPDFPATDLDGLIAYAKKHPGEVAYATPNSTSLVASETIRRLAGIQVNQVRYKSSPQALTDLMGGTVQFYVADVGSSLSTIKSNKVRALAVTTGEPIATLPGVPPVGRSVKGFDLTSWNGIFGPAGLPREVVERLDGALQKVMADDKVKSLLTEQGFEVSMSRSPGEFADYVRQQLEHWTDLVHQAGIPAE